METTLYMVIPCYNEAEVLPITNKMFCDKLEELIQNQKISGKSRILYVNDGSIDDTWSIIQDISQANEKVAGISLSKNQGHQNALLAGLMEAKELCDITISLDCDGQDDINAIDKMIEEYNKGCEIVYGVREDRKHDKRLKRTTAEGYYKTLKLMGVEVVYNHADYRLVSSKVLKHFEDYKEVNLYLRGMFPLVGFKSSCVYYERKKRIAGKTHYPLRKMFSLAAEGVTSLSIKPIRIIAAFGFLIAFFSFIGVVWSFVQGVSGNSIPGWASTTSIVCFVSGIQLISLGVIGEYIGKIYMEVKRRPRYIISERTENMENNRNS